MTTRRTALSTLAAAPLVKAGSSYPLNDKAQPDAMPGHCPLHSSMAGKPLGMSLATQSNVGYWTISAVPVLQCPQCGLLFASTEERKGEGRAA